MAKRIIQYKEGSVERREGFFGTVCPYTSCLHMQVACLHTAAEGHRVSKDRDVTCAKCSRTYSIKKEEAA